jgi:hypothetical protein
MTQVEEAPGTPPELPLPLIDVADDTYLRVAPSELARLVADSAWWIRWWPDLVPHVTRDRGVKGQQWTVTGALRGSMEIWLEPVGGGTVVHWYLRADPARPRVARSPRRVRRERERRVRAWKSDMYVLKDRLERADAS